jgi:ATP-dependent DNA helicase RecG
MVSIQELEELLAEMESDHIERMVSVDNTDKFSEAICAFSNDFPNHKQPGYLIIGVDDKTGKRVGLEVTDKLLKDLAVIRVNGQVLPQPSMTVARFSFDDGEVAVVEVFPTPFPPMRYKGNVWIRVGPTKAIANEAEERILTEKRTSSAKTFDAMPAIGSKLDDLNLQEFKQLYLPNAVDPEILEHNHRDFKQQISSLRMYDLVYDVPTHAGILLFGLNPTFYLPGAYIQYVKFEGVDLSSLPKEKVFKGGLITQLRLMDDFIKYNILEEAPVPISVLQEKTVFNYPFWAIRELVMNAVMHRSYESNAPILIRHFSDRIEIVNSGGLYGEVRPDNFPDASDYRNPVLAEAMKVLGFVNKFNYGIRQAERFLKENGNPPPEFSLDLVTKFAVTIKISQEWLRVTAPVKRKEL